MPGVFSSPRTHLDPPTAKKLSDEEIKQSADRLSVKKTKDVVLPPLVERRVLNSQGLQSSLDRLYTNSVEHKKRMLETLDKKAHPDMVKHTTLESDVLQSTFARLHDRSVESKNETLKKLRKKYLHEGAPKKSITKDEISSSANRLCNESMDKTKESHQKLYDKYVVGTSTKFPKLTADKIKESADRLSRKDK